MAGYLLCSDTTFQETYTDKVVFHIGDVARLQLVRHVASRVALMQLDGDELDAALWGLDNYQKGASLVVRHDPYCMCSSCAATKRGERPQVKDDLLKRFGLSNGQMRTPYAHKNLKWEFNGEMFAWGDLDAYDIARIQKHLEGGTFVGWNEHHGSRWQQCEEPIIVIAEKLIHYPRKEALEKISTQRWS